MFRYMWRPFMWRIFGHHLSCIVLKLFSLAHSLNIRLSQEMKSDFIPAVVQEHHGRFSTAGACLQIKRFKLID